MTEIIISRNKGWFGRMRTAIILADNVEIGRVKSNESVNVKIPEQTRNLYIKMDWGKSSAYPVNKIKNGQTLYMNARSTMSPLRMLGISSIPIKFENEPR